MKAMLFAAGLGTRLGNLTTNKPKALVEVNGKPLIEYAINYLKLYGITDIIINVHHFADSIINFVESKNNFNINIQFSDERDLLLETGGGLLKAKHFFENEDCFVVFNTDIYTSLNLEDLINEHLKNKSLATLAVRKRKSSRYFLFSNDGILSGWENTKTNEKIITRQNEKLNNFAFSGIHVISNKIFDLIQEKQNTKFSITKSYLQLSEKYKIMAFEDNSDYWIDAGKPESLKEIELILRKINL